MMRMDDLKKILAEIRRYRQASMLLEFDQNTQCPEKGREESGETQVALRSLISRIVHGENYIRAVEGLYEERERLSERDRRLIDGLYRDHLRTKDFGPEQEEENKRIKNRTYLKWLSSREQDSCRDFLKGLSEVAETEKQRVSLWDGSPEDLPASLYDRMLDENEPGMRTRILDPILEDCCRETVSLLKRINAGGKDIRKDFLYRRVSDEQQRKLADFLLDTIGFDRERGVLSLGEFPFTEAVNPDDVRMTTCFEEGNFLANYTSVLHEGGHSLFEQLLPEEDHAHFIAQRISQGMHESVARFYENVIGRSRAFIHYVYPKLCELMPQVFCDVMEQELYEAVNAAEPGFIRTDADELTYNLHIMIRYEIERDLVEGKIKAEELPEIWRRKYGEYLGIVPEDDNNGILQDSHWCDGFGYFPTYTIGNIYAAAFYQAMKQSFDVETAVSNGHFDKINGWMKEHVFARANLLDPPEWIRSITGEEFSVTPFINYLREKMDEIYRLSDLQNPLDREFADYSARMSRIRLLSSAQVDGIGHAEAYRSVLAENFKTIGQLAEENRRFINDVLDPILKDEEPLSEDMIKKIRSFNDSLMDVRNRENIDLPVMSELSARLLKDAVQKEDTDYLIQQLDAEIDATTSLLVQLMRVISDHSMTEMVRKRGRDALDKLLGYLDKSRFLSLSPESRESVMINSRYADALFVDMKPLTEKEKAYRIRLLKKSIEYASDPFYRDALPDYDWKYHLYRAYQYFSSFDTYNNACGFTKEELREAAGYGEKVVELWESEPDYYGEFDRISYIRSVAFRNKMSAGLISGKEYREHLLEIYEKRDARRFDSDSLVENIEVPREYISTLDGENIAGEEKILVESMYRSAVNYVFNMPKMGCFYELMEYFAPLLFEFREIPGGITFEEMGLKSFAAFHPPTYIHSMMVARISLCITEYLLKRRPELFVGILGAKDREDVKAKSPEIADFVYHGALCHDFGKLIIIDTVFIYGRKLLDLEFNMIKQHPSLGAMMLRAHYSTAKYADIAEGHHLWYNGQGGYPNSFSAEKSGVKILIDIVTVADCMDAATDSVGRSYNRGKTFGEFREEVKQDAGVRYSPAVSDILFDEGLEEEITFILKERRKQAYLDTYKLLKNTQME